LRKSFVMNRLPRMDSNHDKMIESYSTLRLPIRSAQGHLSPGAHQAVAIDSATLHPSFCALEKLVEDANVNMDSYAVLCRPIPNRF
jgi:hypothetical protein